MSEATSRTATKRAASSHYAGEGAKHVDAVRFDAPITSINRVEADGVKVFYRAAGEANAPVVLLLHGFPASSFMFRELIPRLANDFRVIAPDLPGFGFTEVPTERKYAYSFDQLAVTIDAFTKALKLDRYAIYVFDYGAPTGLRLAMAHPERVTAIVSQNGNAYEEGLGDAWGPIRQYWASPTAENRHVLRKNILTLEGTRWQYTHGVTNPETVPPESYTLDAALLERPGNKDIQLDLFLDYASNVKLYPKFQEYFRKSKPLLLAIWGKNDPFFIPAGAEAFRKDIPSARVQFLDTGHFAIETHAIEIASAMKDFFENEWYYAQRRREHGSKMSSYSQSSTIVLVHGAWADGSCWKDVILPLKRQGLKVACAPIPLTSLTEDISALTRALERTSGPVVLAGHAYGGAVIGAIHEDRVKSFVYVAALAPDEGETVAQVFYRDDAHPKAPKLAPDKHGFIWMPEEGFSDAVAHKASPDQTKVMAAVQRPIALQCIQEAAPAPGWKAKPSWFLLAEEDRMINPKTQQFMASRMGAKIRSSRVDHSPMYTATDLVVEVILEAARATLGEASLPSHAANV